MSRINCSKAFTLIELLIVVLIIAILAAIAIPNFLEYQTRAKVARVKSDQRTMATAFEAYCVDEGTYPFPRWESYATADQTSLARAFTGFNCLTSPIAYLPNIPRDPFVVGRDNDLQYESYTIVIDSSGASSSSTAFYQVSYGYLFGSGQAGYFPHNGMHYGDMQLSVCDTWAMVSVGPDKFDETPVKGLEEVAYFCTINYPWAHELYTEDTVQKILEIIYDPTNGSVSRGQLYRAGGRPPPERVVKMWFDLVNR